MQVSKQESLEISTKYFLNARIREFCKTKKINQADIERLGINKSTVSMVWHDKQMPGIEFIQKMVNEFRTLNTYWLLLGEGEMLVNQNSGGLQTYSALQTVNDTPHVKNICGDCTLKQKTINDLNKKLITLHEKYDHLLEKGFVKKEVKSYRSAQGE